jgi:hypothetical protein
MSLWLMLGVIMLAGAAGGLLNAYFTDNGFVWPKVELVGAFTITRPGFLGSMLVGGVAAAVSWGLYGPFAGMSIFGSTEAARPGAALTVSALVGAVLVGIGGGRWLTDQADKSLLKATAAHAAQGKANPEASAAIAASRPAAALEIARKL